MRMRSWEANASLLVWRALEKEKLIIATVYFTSEYVPKFDSNSERRIHNKLFIANGKWKDEEKETNAYFVGFRCLFLHFICVSTKSEWNLSITETNTSLVIMLRSSCAACHQLESKAMKWKNNHWMEEYSERDKYRIAKAALQPYRLSILKCIFYLLASVIRRIINGFHNSLII